MAARDIALDTMGTATGVVPAGCVAQGTECAPVVCLNPLLESERDRVELYLDVVGTMIVVLDREARVELVNRRGCEILGQPAEHLVGRDWFECAVAAADQPVLRERFARRLAGEPLATERLETVIHRPDGEERLVGEPLAAERLETVIHRPDGEERLVSWSGTVLRDKRGAASGLLLAGEDITERRRDEEQIAYLAYHDGLTGLPNRVSLERHLDSAIVSARSTGEAVALVYVDLDDFKVVNDSLGHTAGDDVLREVAQRLSAVTRPGDFVVRQGGDEFLIVISGIAAEDPGDVEASARRTARVLADRIGDALMTPLRAGDTEFALQASVGVSVFPCDAADAQELQMHADAAMYRAKRSGSGVAEYRSSAGDPLSRLSMAARIHRALERDEFELHYQPIVRLPDQQIAGVEALLRWTDPEHGRVPPGVFIPLAEKAGLIEPLGEWLVAAACRQARLWLEDGLAPHLGINVSPRQLRRAGSGRQMVETIREHGLEAHRFVFELTESAWLLEASSFEPAVAELQAAGATVALDDFGAEYSSLSRLRTLPVGVIKIDRAFMADIPGDPRARAIVAAILGLAESCDCDVVAEGVESEAQLGFLLEQGCRLAQGFHFAVPAPAAEVTSLLRNGLAAERRLDPVAPCPAAR